jgi:hypothetical protein
VLVRVREGVTSTGRRRSIWPGVAAAAGLLLLLLSVPNLGPAFRAARADGVPGLFVADHVTCANHAGHEQCFWYGTFRAGVAGAVARPDVYLYGRGKESLRPGERVAALDVGRPARVYPPEGSNEWIPTVGMAVLGLAMLVPPGRAVLRRVRRE